MSGGDQKGTVVAALGARPYRQRGGTPTVAITGWRAELRAVVRRHLSDFLLEQCVGRLDAARVDIAGEVLRDFLDGGKYVRSTFMYLGWLCGADEDDAALRASASLELLHAFALMQDDVMDGSPLRRARPSAHVMFARWHRDRALTGPAQRFGESAAILLGDLCLVWAEQMLRRSGVGPEALARVWPRYDDMRTELAIGQFSDLVNSSQTFPSLAEVLDILRRKSGNYTVRRPLEIGAAMAGCDTHILDALSGYGTAIGEAFQLRDDLLGVFGNPSLTGKSACTDMEARKATSVIVAAHELAGPGLRREMSELMSMPQFDIGAVDRWRTLIVASGAVQWIEELIVERHRRALNFLDRAAIPDSPRRALIDMAIACTKRAA